MTARYFSEYLREYKVRGSIAFEGPALVRHGDGEEAADSLSFATLALPDLTRPSLGSLDEPDVAALGLVFPLIKRPGTAFDYISVGRTANVDVTLALLQVSKFHAYFSRGQTGQWTIADGGSKNGTRVGPRQVEVRKPVAVSNGDRVYFGPYLFTFFTNQGFFDYVANKARVAL